MNSENLHSVTFSQESAVGLLHYNLPDGLQLDLFGPEIPAPVNLSVLPAKEKALTITATSGLSSDASLRTANRQSLENRLRQRMDVNGSPEYALTWKTWDMESGPPICALRASQRRISDKDYTGWPNPRTVTGGAESAERKQELGRTKSGGGDLQAVALIAGWPSPAAQNASGGPNPLGNVGEHFTLQTAAVLAGWVTPSSRDYKDTPGNRPDRHEPGRLDQVENRSVATAGGNSWSDYIVIPCGDGKARRIKPGIAPLADGIPGRVGLIRGYGNAICPEVGAEFIEAFLAARP